MDTRTQTKHPVDTGWAWMICFGTAMVNFYVTGGIRIVGLLFIEIVEYYDADNALASMVMALLSAGFAICSCLGNILGVRFGMRPVAIVGSCFAFAGTSLTAAAPNVNVVLITLGLMSGIGYGLMFGPSMVLIGLYFKKYASAASGLAVAGGSIGQLALPHFINFVSEKYAFRGALLMYSGLMLHAIPATMLLRPPDFYDPKSRSGMSKASEKKPPLHSVCQTMDKKRPFESESNGRAAAKCEESSVEKVLVQNGKEAAKSKSNGEKHAPRLQFSAEHSPPISGASSPSAVRSRTRFWLHDGALVEKRASLFLADSGRPSLPLLATSVQDIEDELKRLHQPEVEDDANSDADEGAESSPGPRSALGVFCRKCCDPVLLRNPLFVMFALGLSFGHGGYVTTCLYVAPYAYELWHDKFLLAVIISVVGVADLFGRIGGGFVAGLNVIRKPFLVGGSFIISGACTILMPFAPTKVVFFVYATVLGMLGGTYMAQIVVQIVELFGPGLLASGLGLSTMFMGLFVIPIPPTLGAAQKSAGTFSISLRLSGMLLIFGGLFFCLIPLVEWHQRRKRQLQAASDDSDGDTRNEASNTANLRPRPTMSLATVESAAGQEDSNLNWTQFIDLPESDI